MIDYQRLSQQPKIFKNLSGVTIAEYNELFRQTYPLWQQREQERLNRLNRQRAIGGGRKFELKFREQLLMSLVWLRLYLNTEALGYFFGVDKSDDETQRRHYSGKKKRHTRKTQLIVNEQ